MATILCLRQRYFRSSKKDNREIPELLIGIGPDGRKGLKLTCFYLKNKNVYIKTLRKRITIHAVDQPDPQSFTIFQNA